MNAEYLLFKLKKETELALKVHADLAFTLGIYYGYPICCRQEFCNDIINDRDPSIRYINDKGFIPCRKHFNEIMLGEIKIEDLISENRICNEKY